MSVINDILDFSKIESGHMNLEQKPYVLKHCLEQVLDLSAPLIVNKQIEMLDNVDADVPEVIVGDEVRLRQILVNLASNAIKFTHKGTVSISVERQPTHSAQGEMGTVELLFSVSDTGIGISPEEVPNLFNAFTQADASTTRRFGGTGLGLSISTQLVQLMGGNIQVESKFGVGSRFFFTLPIQTAMDQASQPTLTGSQLVSVIDSGLAKRHPLNILLVEDNLVNQMVGMKILEKMGYQAHLVQNGIEAINATAKQHYDIVFMDMQMPEMDGLEATREIVKNPPATGRPTIIAMTANTLEGDRQLCLDAGMDDYISKPVSITKIQEAIQKWGQPLR